MPLSTHSLEKEESSQLPLKHGKKRKSKHPPKAASTHQTNHDSQLLEAASQGKLRVAKRLLDSRANPNTTNEVGQTPLMLACTVPDDAVRKDLVDLLLRRAADVNMQDHRGQTVLMSAVLLEDDDVIDCLLRFKCSTKLIDSDGNSALYYAAVSGNELLVRKLVGVAKQQGVDIDQQNVQGLTALLVACQEGHLEVAKILVQVGGASPMIRDLDHFMTAQEWIQISGFYGDEELSFLSPAIQRRSFNRRQRKMKGIKTLTDYITSSESSDGSDSPNVFSCRRGSHDNGRLPNLVSSQQPLSMFGGTGGKSMFDAPPAAMATRTPGYALGCPVPAKPLLHSKAGFLTTRSDLYSSSYLSRRKTFLTENPRSGYFHSGALEPLEGQRSSDTHVQTDKGSSHGNKRKNDLLPPIKR